MDTVIDAAFRTALYLGAVLLLGAGVFRRFVGPELALQMRRTLRFGTIFGALLLIFSSIGDVIWRITALLGRFDGGFILEYTLATHHGRATLVRLGLVIVVLVSSLKRRQNLEWLSGGLFALSALGMLGTFSFLSHAATLHGPPALLADLMHFSAATLWGGAVFYVSLSPAWQHEPTDEPADEVLVTTMKRVSSLGLFCVLLLAATGLYATLLHLGQPAQLVTTPYGLALTVKLALVGIILGIAALNRWWFLPALHRGETRRLGQMLKLEAFILIVVFAATGLLTTRAPPHT